MNFPRRPPDPAFRLRSREQAVFYLAPKSYAGTTLQAEHNRQAHKGGAGELVELRKSFGDLNLCGHFCTSLGVIETLTKLYHDPLIART